MNNPTRYKMRVVNMIDSCVDLSLSIHENDIEKKRFVVNIDFENQSKENVATCIIPAVRNSAYLSKYFIYTKEHGYYYMFRHRFVLTFNREITDFSEGKILDALYDCTSCIKHRIFGLKVVNPSYLIFQFKDEKLYILLENLLSTVSADIYSVYSSTSIYNSRKSMLLSIVLLTRLAIAIGLSELEFHSVCLFLSRKWLCNEKTNTNVNFRKTIALNYASDNHAKKFFLTNKFLLRQLYLTAKNSPDDIEEMLDNKVSISLDEISKFLKNAKFKIEDCEGVTIPDNIVTAARKQEVYLFGVMAEFILETLFVNNYAKRKIILYLMYITEK